MTDPRDEPQVSRADEGRRLLALWKAEHVEGSDNCCMGCATRVGGVLTRSGWPCPLSRALAAVEVALKSCLGIPDHSCYRCAPALSALAGGR